VKATAKVLLLGSWKETTGDTVVQVLPLFAVVWIQAVHGSRWLCSTVTTFVPGFFVVVLLAITA
jgi:hypothetical protein